MLCGAFRLVTCFLHRSRLRCVFVFVLCAGGGAGICPSAPGTVSVVAPTVGGTKGSVSGTSRSRVSSGGGATVGVGGGAADDDDLLPPEGFQLECSTGFALDLSVDFATLACASALMQYGTLRFTWQKIFI